MSIAEHVAGLQGTEYFSDIRSTIGFGRKVQLTVHTVITKTGPATDYAVLLNGEIVFQYWDLGNAIAAYEGVLMGKPSTDKETA